MKILIKLQNFMWAIKLNRILNTSGVLSFGNIKMFGIQGPKRGPTFENKWCQSKRTITQMQIATSSKIRKMYILNFQWCGNF